MFSMKVYVAVAAAIAVTAFAIGQVQPGAGVPFVILASIIWTGFSVTRARKLG